MHRHAPLSLPCRSRRGHNYSVQFHTTKSPSRTNPAALKVCNTLIDHWVVVDSGASNTFVKESDTNIINPGDSICVGVANHDTIDSIGTTQLPFDIPNLNQGHVFHDKDLSNTLLAVGDFCDAGMNVLFNKDTVKIYNATDGNTRTLYGRQNPRLRLYELPLGNTTGAPRVPPARPPRVPPNANQLRNKGNQVTNPC